MTLAILALGAILARLRVEAAAVVILAMHSVRGIALRNFLREAVMRLPAILVANTGGIIA